jgi:hypothetical protein
MTRTAARQPFGRRSFRAVKTVAAKGLLGWLACSVVALLQACGGGGSDTAAAPAQPQALALAPVDRGSLLDGGWSAYPRLVRLEHQADPAQNGRVIASLTENTGGVWRTGFHASSDGGAHFSRLSELTDPAYARGLCCGTLYELPRDVGALTAGTLLYAASVGADVAGTLMENRIYRSTDAGTSFSRVEGATCGRSAVPRSVGAGGSGVWEPEFLIAADGSLACIYSDETEPGRSQVLKLTTTRDGVAWSAPVVIVAGTEASDRPGMAGVRRLPSGRYAMTYEHCSTARLDCTVRLKLSNDGLHWGAPGSAGTRPQTADGRYFRHAPTLAWAPVAGHPNGVLALIGQILTSDNSVADPVYNGRVLLLNASADGSGDWLMQASPIGLPGAPQQTNWCQNYATPLLPSPDGSQLLLMQTDSTADGGCNARFGQGSLGL